MLNIICKSKFKVAVGIPLLLVFVACGKKGDVKPPEAFAPKSVETLQAVRVKKGVLLTWNPPTQTEDGDNVRDLAGFLVRRATGTLHPAEYDFEEIGEVQATSPETGTLGESKPSSSVIANSNIAGSASAYSFVDETIVDGEKAVYSVSPYNLDGVEGLPSMIPVAAIRLPVPSGN